MDVAKIRVIAEGMTGEATAELDKLNKKTEETGKSTDKFGDTFSDTVKKMTAGVGTIVAVAAAMKQVYEAGKEGAVVEQTAESFERLASTLPANVDLLEQLSDAAAGTVDDMTLMSSTLTLVAGTSGEMQSALMMATPQLLEIAKAANKLNPTLGDTAFLYESIATGIKRGSPMILDNLGIVVKVSEATEEYAKSLGKTADELTANERTMALLNGTMEAGKNLIEQAGGAAGGAVDPYSKLETQTKNLTDSSKKLTAEGLRPAITSLGDYVEEMNDATDKTLILREALDAGIITMEEYGSLTNSARFATEHYEKQVRLLQLRLELLNSEAPKTLDFFQEYSPLAAGATEATKEVGEAEIELTKELERQLEERTKLITEYNEDRISEIFKFTDMETEYTEEMMDLNAELADVEKQMLTARGAKLDELKEKQGELVGKINEVRVAHDEATAAILFNYTEQILAADGLTQAEADYLIELGIQMGIMTEEAVADMEIMKNAAAIAAAGIGNQSFDWNINLHMNNVGGNSGLGANEMPGGLTDYVPFAPGIVTGRGTTGTGAEPKLEATGINTVVSSPTMFMAGEAGQPEQVNVTPMGAGGGGDGMNTALLQQILNKFQMLPDEMADALIAAEGKRE